MTLSVWIGRALLIALAVFLVLPWAQAEFGVMRGGAVAGVEAHLFFLGLASLCLLGLASTFQLDRRGKVVAGVILLSAFSGAWLSLSLVMMKTMSIWLWLVLSTLWYALPVAVLVTFFTHGTTIHSSWVWPMAGLAATFAAIVLLVAWRPLIISTHKLAVGAIEGWVAHRSGLNRLRFDFMIWSVAGGPPPGLDAAGHRQALLRLGYFQQTNFNLHQARLHDVLEHARRAHFADSLWMVEPSKSARTFKLTAYGGDMGLWQTVVQEADRGQPNGPTNESPPIRSETNQTPSAAGSRR